MAVIIPFDRRDYVLRPSVSLVPLPARVAAEPLMAQAARALGMDVAAIRWGGDITLVASLAVGAGRVVTVQARADQPLAPSDHVEALTVVAPAMPASQVASGQFVPGGRAEVKLRLRVPRAQMVAAVARHGDGRLSGLIAEVRVTG